MMFKVLLSVSLLIAIANLICPPLIPSFPLAFVILIAAFWGYLVLQALRLCGRRGLWLLIGAPLALFWPLVIVSVLLGYADLP